MRNTFIHKVVEYARLNPNVFLVTGDLGFNVLNEFYDEFPNHYFNAGICEQNMMSVAAGLAMEGNLVFVYSISNFPTMRCLEQIRNDVCYNNANVKIIGVGAGFSYGQMGPTHHATEDIAVMSSLPNMAVYSAADKIDAMDIFDEVVKFDGPAYIRLGRGHENDIIHAPGNIQNLFDGNDVCIVSTGTIINEAINAHNCLKSEGIEVGVCNILKIKPFDSNTFRSIVKKYKCIVTLEEHTTTNGLGSVVIDSLNGLSVPTVKMGLKNTYTNVVGDQQYLRKYYQISSEDVVNCVKNCLSSIINS